jgi:hypothetical protein
MKKAQQAGYNARTPRQFQFSFELLLAENSNEGEPCQPKGNEG